MVKKKKNCKTADYIVITTAVESTSYKDLISKVIPYECSFRFTMPLHKQLAIYFIDPLFMLTICGVIQTMQLFFLIKN